MKKLLITAYWIGIIADAIATILLFSPQIANLLLQPQSFEISAQYLYVTRIAGALMAGWTALLLWARNKPIERADILLITLFPVVTLMLTAAILAARTGQLSVGRLVPMFILYILIFVTFIPSYLWARKQKESS